MYKFIEDIEVGDKVSFYQFFDGLAVTEIVPVSVTDGVDKPHRYVLFYENGDASIFKPGDKIYMA